MKRPSALVRRIAKGLGASEVIDLGPVARRPFGILALADDIRRLQSTGGRPGNPAATLPRIVKFQPRVWEWLRRKARDCKQLSGRSVSPAQLASLFVERVWERERRNGSSIGRSRPRRAL